jgi:DNA primase
MQYKIVTLLERILNDGIVSEDGECSFFCPFCHHHKRKFTLNIFSGKSHCWVCNKKFGSVLYLAKALSTDTEYIRTLVDEFNSTSNNKIKYGNQNNEEVAIHLPYECKPAHIKQTDIIYRHVKKYLSDRGITTNHMMRYSIGYCETGPYANRVIVPSFDSDCNLNYFIARDIFPNSSFKYKNPKVSKDIVMFDNTLYWDDPIVLVEGVFDAISVGINAIPILGKMIQPMLMNKLITSKNKDIYVCLDSDAKKVASIIASELMDNGKNVYLVDLPEDKDPSDLGHIKINELIRNTTKQCTFSDIMKWRIYG